MANFDNVEVDEILPSGLGQQRQGDELEGQLLGRHIALVVVVVVAISFGHKRVCRRIVRLAGSLTRTRRRRRWHGGKRESHRRLVVVAQLLERHVRVQRPVRPEEDAELVDVRGGQEFATRRREAHTGRRVLEAHAVDQLARRQVPHLDQAIHRRCYQPSAVCTERLYNLCLLFLMLLRGGKQIERGRKPYRIFCWNGRGIYE